MKKCPENEDEENKNRMQYGDWLWASPLRRGYKEKPFDPIYNAKKKLFTNYLDDQNTEHGHSNGLLATTGQGFRAATG